MLCSTTGRSNEEGWGRTVVDGFLVTEDVCDEDGDHREDCPQAPNVPAQFSGQDPLLSTAPPYEIPIESRSGSEDTTGAQPPRQARTNDEQTEQPLEEDLRPADGSGRALRHM